MRYVILHSTRQHTSRLHAAGCRSAQKGPRTTFIVEKIAADRFIDAVRFMIDQNETGRHLGKCECAETETATNDDIRNASQMLVVANGGR